MMGRAYFSAAAVYITLMFLIVRWAWRAGRRNGSTARGGVFAFLGFLAVYLPVFWNHIPVLLEQQARCARDAGFKVHVTPMQWVDKNKDVVPVLRGIDLERFTPSRSLPSGYSRYEFFGGALARETISKDERKFGTRFGRTERRLLDARTGELLAVDTDYSVGSREDLKFWLRQSCPARESGAAYPSIAYTDELKEAIK